MPGMPWHLARCRTLPEVQKLDVMGSNRGLATNIICSFGARQREVSVDADHRLLPASLFECGSKSISQMSPLKSPSTRMI
jgi:hypothetical protein